jgi:hypothetical protein
MGEHGGTSLELSYRTDEVARRAQSGANDVAGNTDAWSKLESAK